MTPIAPLLAADPGTIIGLIVGALTLLGWILNYANQKQVQQPPVRRPNRPVRPQRPADDRLQSEIDVFLEEVRGGRRKLADPHARPPAAEAPARAERAVEALPPRRPAEQRHLEPKITRHLEPRVGQSRVGRRPGPARAERTRLRPAEEAVPVERVEVPITPPPPNRVEEGVRSHLGLFTGGDAPAPIPAVEPAAAPPPGSLAQQVRALLQQPAGVRQAVLISEILARPQVGPRRRR
jgi:hypothetical protein